jgi:hypothetical protein
MPADTDPILASLHDDLRAQLAALNHLHHPVYGGDARRIAELEGQVADIRAAIAARKRSLAA